jgi:hypothetical protein
MANNPIFNKDPLGDTIIINFVSQGKNSQIIYQGGSFFKKDGSNLSKDDNGYASKVLADLYIVDNLGDKEVSNRIDKMESSKKLHLIEMTDPGKGNSNSAESNIDDQNGVPTGSTTKYNPDAKTDINGNKRDPIIGLTHELLGHAYDSNEGKSNYNKTSNGIPLYEVSGVNIENRVRVKLNEPKRIQYGGNPYPLT